jgi:hypothetical protein
VGVGVSWEVLGGCWECQSVSVRGVVRGSFAVVRLVVRLD